MERTVQTDSQVQRVLEKVAYSLEEAADALGIGLTMFTELVLSGEIPSFRIRRRRLVRKMDLQSFADRLFDQQNSEHGDGVPVTKDCAK
jgi:excisionase family DNA binding protein